MTSPNQEKAEQGVETLLAFLQQFGEPNPHTEIVLNVLFEEFLSYQDKEKPSS